MSSSQKRAVRTYRNRLVERGLARFEVLGLETDRELIRGLARSLAERGSEDSALRTALNQAIGGDAPAKGGVLAALRRSPLVGAGLELRRPRTGGRKVTL